MWNLVFFSDCKQNFSGETVVFVGDVNGRWGRIGTGYAGVHRGFGYAIRSADGSRILEFADG